jgi:RNA polymerase sigma-70 factor (ECF subfamily)
VIEERRRGHLGEVQGVESPVGPGVDLGEERFSGLSAAPAAREQRLRALVDDHFDFIWRSLRRLGVPARDADDGAQRVFVVASRRVDDIEVGKERAFLFSTAYRVARDMHRSKARHPEAPLGEEDVLPDSAPNPEQLSDRKQARALLDDVLSGLPLEYRTVFVLFEMEELTVPEIALLVEAPIGTVASRLRRARELFRAAASRVRMRALHGQGGPR